jgi:transaldolase
MLKETPRASLPSVASLTTKIFADGADRAAILKLAANPLIKGFTTNPTLMRQSGVVDYAGFAREILKEISDRPISFEVFADDEAEMERQARLIAGWGANVYVKIPVTNTAGQSMDGLVRRLSHAGIKLNITAMMTPAQVKATCAALSGGAPAFVSVFAGRIADTGRDPVPLMSECLRLIAIHKDVELIWASPRELLNVFQADAIGCHIITVTGDLLAKLANVGRDLDEYSLATVKMFHDDAKGAGYRL